VPATEVLENLRAGGLDEDPPILLESPRGPSCRLSHARFLTDPPALPHPGQTGEDDPVVRAYVLIQTSVGLASEVARQLSAMPQLDSAVHVTGPYDVVASVSAEDLDDLGRLVAFGVGHV
jgi:DNA-binding Lrp family transcriptional regulator